MCSQHSTERYAHKDAARDTKLAADGFKVVRVWNNEVDRNLEGVFEHILHALSSEQPPTPTARSARRRTSPRGGG
jgi:very-short-patch-repair endonuclease